MRMICFLVILSTSLAYSQTVDELTNGFTFMPKPQTFIFNAVLSSSNATSQWNEDGEEISYNYLLDGKANPEIIFKTISFTFGYSISDKFRFYLSMPVIVEQKLKANAAAGYEQYYQDYCGQTGIRDISIGGRFLLTKSKQLRMKLGLNYQLSSGSSPDYIGENELSSTGSGHTAKHNRINICGQ